MQLYREPKLTYTEARDLALADETAAKDSTKRPLLMSTKTDPSGRDLEKVLFQRGLLFDHKDSRYRFGGKHDASRCRLKEYGCLHCYKKGHLAAVCHTKARELQAQEQTNLVAATPSQ